MPKVLGYTPSWLVRPSPGFELFAPNSSSNTSNGHRAALDYSGPTKTVAKRGTEVFVAVGNEIRWSDLTLLKETNQTHTLRSSSRRMSKQNRKNIQDDPVLHRVSKTAKDKPELG